MSTNGHHAPPEPGHRRRNLLIVGAIVLALLVFGVGYAIGSGNGGSESASPTLAPSPTATHTRSPKPSPSGSESPSETESPSESADPNPTAEPLGDTLPGGRYFVRLNDLQGGEDGPPLVKYDLAYFLTGADADKAAKDRGLETPVPDGYFIVNDSHRTRFVPLADSFGVRYIPEGNCCQPVKAHNAQFLGWLGETTQSDFPPKETSWWWITIAGGEVTKVEQQFLP
jgi:hypothetical protein